MMRGICLPDERPAARCTSVHGAAIDAMLCPLRLMWSDMTKAETMRPALTLILIAAVLPLTSGCVRTIASVVTAPVKVAGKAADWATTSQDEADRARGRDLRAKEERIGKLSRQRDKASEKCRDGIEEQCDRAEILDQEIDAEMARPI